MRDAGQHRYLRRGRLRRGPGDHRLIVDELVLIPWTSRPACCGPRRRARLESLYRGRDGNQHASWNVLRTPAPLLKHRRKIRRATSRRPASARSSSQSPRSRRLFRRYRRSNPPALRPTPRKLKRTVGSAELLKGARERVGDLVVHRPTELGMRMTDDTAAGHWAQTGILDYGLDDRRPGPGSLRAPVAVDVNGMTRAACTVFVECVASPTVQMLGASRSQWSLPLASDATTQLPVRDATHTGPGLGELLAALRVLSISTYRLRLAPSQSLRSHGRAHKTGAELP